MHSRGVNKHTRLIFYFPDIGVSTSVHLSAPQRNTQIVRIMMSSNLWH